MKKMITCVLLSLALLASMYAQEDGKAAETADAAETAESVQGAEYRIHDVLYSIHGITKPFALKRNVDIDYDRKFVSEEEIDTYLEYLAQQLNNTRLLDDISVTYELLEPEEEFVPVDIKVQASDSSHFLILPKPSYDSNTGFDVELNLKDNNFLGFMNPLSFDLNLDYGTDGTIGAEKKLTLGTDFSYNYPFSVGRTEDTWKNSFSLDWTVGDSAPDFSYSTGIEAAIPFGKNFLRTSFTQSLTREGSYEYCGDSLYFSEGFSIALPLTIGRIEDKIPVYYTPSFDMSFNWDADGISYSGLKGPSMHIRQNLSVSDVNWKGNFRNGYQISLSHYISYNFNFSSFSPYLSMEIKAFKAFKYAGINFRAYGYGVINDRQNNIGGKLRGILDNQYYGDASKGKALETDFAMAFSLDVPVHIVTTDWMGWGRAIFGPYDELSSGMQKVCWLPHKVFPYLDFEMQISPFVDVGLTNNRASGRTVNPRDAFVDAGLEVLVYPSRFKSYVVRGSFGVDVGRKLFSGFLDTDWRDMNVRAYEISIGLGLQF